MEIVEIISYPSEKDWLDVKNKALVTIGKETDINPTDSWKSMILRSEHSPIRDLIYSWKWIDLKYWISVHFVRHKIGIEHFVQSQRNDRQSKYNRDEAPQSALVTHSCTANAQAIINISHMRLCHQSHEETKFAWSLFLFKLQEVEPNLVNLCVPKCIYRNGFCTEPRCCGYNNSKLFKDRLKEYSGFIKNEYRYTNI